MAPPGAGRHPGAWAAGAARQENACLAGAIGESVDSFTLQPKEEEEEEGHGAELAGLGADLGS